jgi:DNA primase
MSALLDRDLIERARAIDILSVVSRYGARLRKAGGGEFVGPCPRCGGRDRFSVNVRKAIWNCRGCAKGGDVIALVQHITGVDFAEAIELLTGETWPAPQLAEVRHRRERGSSADNAALALRI